MAARLILAYTGTDDTPPVFETHQEIQQKQITEKKSIEAAQAVSANRIIIPGVDEEEIKKMSPQEILRAQYKKQIELTRKRDAAKLESENIRESEEKNRLLNQQNEK